MNEQPQKQSSCAIPLMFRAVAVMIVPLLSLALSGCLGDRRIDHGALLAATTPVLDQASAAYHAANAIHNEAVAYQALSSFDREQPVYNPRATQTLISEKDVEVRLTVLQALQLYARSLAQISGGTQNSALQAASQSVGSTLTTLGNDVAPALLTAAASAASSTATDPVTPTVRNGMSTAAYALGQFLVHRKIRRELPSAIKTMDPHIQALCDLFEKDIDILGEQEHRDYNTIIDLQTLYIRSSPRLDPKERKEEIMKLPGIVRDGRATDERLAELRASIARLASAHHALAAEALDRHSESFKDKLNDLVAAGNDLGKFYSSLPTT